MLSALFTRTPIPHTWHLVPLKTDTFLVDNKVRYFMNWVETDFADGGGGGGKGWVNTHVAVYVDIAGPMLGIPKTIPSLLSGEMRDTAILGQLESLLGLDKSLGTCFPVTTHRLCDCPYSYQKGLFPLPIALTVYSYQSLIHVAERLTLSFVSYQAGTSPEPSPRWPVRFERGGHCGRCSPGEGGRSGGGAIFWGRRMTRLVCLAKIKRSGTAKPSGCVLRVSQIRHTTFANTRLTLFFFTSRARRA